jgi:CheY-like chemotaxis protein
MPPHLMISDIGMPDMDGYGLLEAIRASGYTFPVIALTGFASREAEEAGFQRCLAKPIDPDVLCHAAALLLHFEV